MITFQLSSDKNDLITVFKMNRKLLQLSLDMDNSVNINWDSNKEWLNKKFENKNIFIVKNCEFYNDRNEVKIIGYCIAQILKVSAHRIFSKEIEVEEIYIDENYRHKNLASQLINFSANYLYNNYKENDLGKKVFLKVLSKNKSAIEAYKKMGFYEYEHLLEKDIL